MKKDTTFFKTLRVIEVMTVVCGLIIVVIQIKDYRNTNYGLTSLEVTKELYSDEVYPANPKIIAVLHEGSPLLKENDGSISDEELNNFLGLLEWMKSANKVGILSDKIIFEMFSTDIIDAFNNKEIREFINQSREYYQDNDFFSGFEELAKKMIYLQEKIGKN